MNDVIHELIRGIVQGVINVGASGRILIYAMPGLDGGRGLFFFDGEQVDGQGGSFITCAETPRSINDLIRRLWSQWKSVPGNRSWQEMSIDVDRSNHFRMNLLYPDQISEGESPDERAMLAASVVFPGRAVRRHVVGSLR